MFLWLQLWAPTPPIWESWTWATIIQETQERSCCLLDVRIHSGDWRHSGMDRQTEGVSNTSNVMFFFSFMTQLFKLYFIEFLHPHWRLSPLYSITDASDHQRFSLDSSDCVRLTANRAKLTAGLRCSVQRLQTYNTIYQLCVIIVSWLFTGLLWPMISILPSRWWETEIYFLWFFIT